VALAYEGPALIGECLRGGGRRLAVPPLLFRNSSYAELAETYVWAALLRGLHDLEHRIYSDSVEQLERVQWCY